MSYLKFETLPEGVWPIRHYRSLGATLVECRHANRAQVPEPVQIRDTVSRALPVEICSVCKTTRFERPVKLLAIVPDEPAQRSLF